MPVLKQILHQYNYIRDKMKNFGYCKQKNIHTIKHYSGTGYLYEVSFLHEMSHTEVL